ncbi:MAG TPA: hypothetical protein VFR63_03375 [Gaiellaceae bacterium]|nr:hypothetical protein [Gaiellaceae bacterium]
MSRPELVFFAPGADGAAELVVNFGVYAGREATPAEVERLARSFLAEVPRLEVVCEQRYEFAPDAEAAVYRVRVRTPAAAARGEELRRAVAAWAEDCIRERRVTP